ncbi:MAG: glycosyltransferase, partial [Candidatus Faecousia sp.]|nr:glycosyltransferase [Candidatus Faecousia sp.]
MSRKPRVLHILSDVFFSGAENMVCQIVEMFRGEIDMVYASPEGPIREALEARNVTYFPIASVTPGEIRRAIRQVGPDLVHAHDMKASVAAAAACGKTPLISHIHNNGFDSRKISPKTVLFQLASGKIRHIFWVSPSAMT